MKLRTLTDDGIKAFHSWLEQRGPADNPSTDLLDGEHSVPAVVDVEVDLSMVFDTRYEFGKYMVELLGDASVRKLLAKANDGVWDWLTIAFFGQFGKKVSKSWHYSVTRGGHSGSLAYRHLVRTSVEMYWRHRENSLVMLSTDLSTWGDMSEQLTSRQNVAYHRGYIKAANLLYLENGKLRPGAASRVPPISKRQPGDRRGRGGVGRLALAVRRLCRTYDTHILEPTQMINLLPKEFASFSVKPKASAG